MSHRLTFLPLLTGLILLTGCSDDVTNNFPGGPDTVDEAIQVWQSQNIESYTVDVTQICFCLPPKTYRMTVVDGEVTKIMDLDSGDDVEPNDGYLTISDWLDWIKMKSENSPRKLELNFNSALGYPELIDYDQALSIADEEMYVIMENLRVL